MKLHNGVFHSGRQGRESMIRGSLRTWSCLEYDLHLFKLAHFSMFYLTAWQAGAAGIQPCSVHILRYISSAKCEQNTVGLLRFCCLKPAARAWASGRRRRRWRRCHGVFAYVSRETAPCRGRPVPPSILLRSKIHDRLVYDTMPYSKTVPSPQQQEPNARKFPSPTLFS